MPLFALDLVVFTVWLVFLAGITLPAWYWAPWQSIHGVRYHGEQLGYFPNGPHGHPANGLYIDTLPKALLAAVVCLILFTAFSYVLVATRQARTSPSHGPARHAGRPAARGARGTRPSRAAVHRGKRGTPGAHREFIPNGR